MTKAALVTPRARSLAPRRQHVSARRRPARPRGRHRRRPPISGGRGGQALLASMRALLRAHRREDAVVKRRPSELPRFRQSRNSRSRRPSTAAAGPARAPLPDFAWRTPHLGRASLCVRSRGAAGYDRPPRRTRLSPDASLSAWSPSAPRAGPAGALGRLQESSPCLLAERSAATCKRT
jgi:hypothetical protein